ncbi:MAG: SDR family oxidoreductase [Xanthobacteraceae bacterium]|jgi:2-keto-3-deoxy-L-fuconate dehydrogenase
MAGRMKGKVALVTAAGQGIGRAIATAFITEGAMVIATDVDDGKLKGLKAKQRVKLDVRKPKEIEALAKAVNKEFGGLDALANVAGVVHHGSVLDATDAEWDFAFDLNVRSMHRMIQAFLPGMLKKGGGAIVNMSSAASSVRGVPTRYIYGTTKAAVIGLTKSVAMDFIKQGVRVNAICPGTIESPSFRDRVAAHSKRSGKSAKAALQDFIDRQPMGRIGTAEEVASLAVFLACDESKFISGHIHLIDGGWAL